MGSKANQPISVGQVRPDLVSQRVCAKEHVLLRQSHLCGWHLRWWCIIALLYWFFGTEHGLLPCGPPAPTRNMARAQGINTNFTKVLGLMISNGLVALSGALLAQYQGFADVNMGRGAIVIGLAAVIIGEVIFWPRSSATSP